MPLDQWADQRLKVLDPSLPDARQGLERFRQRMETARVRHKRRSWALAAASAFCLAMMILPGGRALAERCAGACGDAGIRLWRALSPSETYRASNRKPAPDFVLPDPNGGAPVRLSDFKGKTVLLNFWAVWCPPCREEIPWFVEFQRTYADRGFIVLGISFDMTDWDSSVKPFLAANKVNYPVAMGTTNVIASYGADSLPATFLIDRTGRIASAYKGMVHKDIYKASIEKLLRE